MSRIKWYGPTLVLLATVLAIMIAGPSVAREMAYNYQKENILQVRESLVNNSQLDQLSHAFRQISKVVEPSVVHIQVAARHRPGDRSGPGDQFGGIDPERLRQWFFGGPPPDLRQQQPDDKFDQYNPARPYANGSGWVYDTKGHIVTNNHVIDGADVITIRFHDGTKRTATVVGADPKTDIAVLKVDDGDLHPAVVAPQPVQQGDLVFAFGSPFGFKFSMSQGIVSAVGRNQLGIIRGGYEDFIQTDAAINPGNSGGPLTDIHGEVVGMNTAIASRTGSNNGLGFAIPTSNLVPVVESLIKSGKVTRGFLGVEISDLDPRMARTFNFTGKGVLVINPIPNTPGAKAGLKAGDIITKLDDKPMTSADLLRNTVAATAPNTTVTLDIFRDGKHQDIKLTVGQLPDSIARAQGPDVEQPNSPEAQDREILLKLGIERAFPLTPDLIQRFNIQGVDKGVLVQSVRRDSAAAVAGIVPGVIITDVMGVPVSNVSELVTQLNKHSLTEGVRVRVMANGQSAFVILQLDTQ